MGDTPKGWPHSRAQARQYYRKWDNWARFVRPRRLRFKLDDLLRDFLGAARGHGTITYSELGKRYHLHHWGAASVGAVAGVIGELGWAKWNLHLSSILVSKTSKDRKQGFAGQGLPSGGMFSLSGIPAKYRRVARRTDAPLTDAEKEFAARAQEGVWRYFGGMNSSGYQTLLSPSPGEPFAPGRPSGSTGRRPVRGHMRAIAGTVAWIEARHQDLSNQFCDWLEVQDPYEKPRSDRHYHDLEWKFRGETYLFELKAVPGRARRLAHYSLREALGQLMDYEIYPITGERFHWRAVVIDVVPTESDREWLRKLQAEFGWPVELFWVRSGVVECAHLTGSQLTSMVAG